MIWRTLLMAGMISMALPQCVLADAQDTNIAGVSAELTQCKRKHGVLTLKVRFTNNGDEKAWLKIETNHGGYDDVYVIADNKKYFVLHDKEGAPLAPKYIDTTLTHGQSYTWWAKFPAPPAEIGEIEFVMPKMAPFEDIAIIDK